jgi:predicted dehydrogenase
MASVRHGKHLYNTLPFATSAADSVAIYEAQKAAGTVGVVDAQFCWVPEAQQMKSMIDAGFIGRPLGFHIELVQPLIEYASQPYPYCADAGTGSPYYWLAEKSSGASAWRNFGSHALLFLTHLLGAVEDASALSAIGVPDWHMPNGELLRAETADLAVAALRLTNGAIGTLHTGWCKPGGECWRVDVWGDKGRLLLSDSSFGTMPVAKLYSADRRSLREGHIQLEQVAIEPAYYSVPGCEGSDPVPRPLIAMDWIFAAMVQAIRDQGEASPSFADAARVHAMVEAIELGAQERRWVRMSELHSPRGDSAP